LAEREVDEDHESSFADLLSISEPAHLSPHDSSKKQPKELDLKLKAEALNEIKKKERANLKLDHQVNMSGVIEFQDYTSKLKMMNSALFMFGMRLH